MEAAKSLRVRRSGMIPNLVAPFVVCGSLVSMRTTFSLLLCCLCACAAIYGKETQIVTIDSKPPGATVTIDGYGEVGITPCAIALACPRGGFFSNRESLWIRGRLEGHQAWCQDRRWGLSTLTFIDCALIVPGMIDLIAGYNLELQDDHIEMVFIPNAVAIH